MKSLDLLHGGAGLTKALRVEYLKLCYQIFDSTADQKAAKDRMLQIIEENVRDHVHTLSHTNRGTLLDDLHQILSSVDPSDTNYSGLINLVALQIAILFTKHLHPNHTTNSAHSILAELPENWKDYTTFKEFVIQKEPTNKILNLPDSRSKMIAFVGFLTIREIVNAIVNKMFFIGISYVDNYVDGLIMTPLEYYAHDKDHEYFAYEENPPCSEQLDTFRNFVEYLQKTNITPSHSYAVYFMLFLILHENACDYISNRTYTELLSSTEDLQDGFEKMYLGNRNDLTNLHFFGLAIPSAYRKMIGNSQLEESKVKEYFDLASSQYIKYWTQFVNQNGGRRRTRRKHNTRRRFTLRSKKRSHLPKRHL